MCVCGEGGGDYQCEGRNMGLGWGAEGMMHVYGLQLYMVMMPVRSV
jgi:hypothetical protein